MAEIKVLSDEAVSLAVPDQAEAQARAAALRAAGGWREVVAGEASVTVAFDPLAETAAEAGARLRSACAAPAPPLPAAGAAVLTIPVRYGGTDGPDLGAVAAETGLAAHEVIARHGASDHVVAMLGFTPGFAYLGGLDPSLCVLRRDVPRPRLPAGSVGISGARTGLYALAGPGGWAVIGRTDARLFDPQAAPPHALAPGQRVRFVPT